MDSAFSTAIPDSSLAAITQLSENSRLGFASENPALHRGIEWSKSTLALGLPEWSGKTASDHVVAANNGTLPNGDVPIYGLMGHGADILAAAGQQASHDLGCAGMGWAVQGGSVAASGAVLSTGTKLGGATSGTSVASATARTIGVSVP